MEAAAPRYTKLKTLGGLTDRPLRTSPGKVTGEGSELHKERGMGVSI